MAKSDRGFASMDVTLRSRIASLGGKAAHAKGTAHRWTSAEAAEAGRRGGLRKKASRAREASHVEEDRTD
jgi:uncharacterized protein